MATARHRDGLVHTPGERYQPGAAFFRSVRAIGE